MKVRAVTVMLLPAVLLMAGQIVSAGVPGGCGAGIASSTQRSGPKIYISADMTEASAVLEFILSYHVGLTP